MSDTTTTTTYPKWPGIVAIVAVSVAGALVFFLAGFAAGRCGGHRMPPPSLAMAGGGFHEQKGKGMPMMPQAGPFEGRGFQFGSPRGDGPFGPGHGPDRKMEQSGGKADSTPAEVAPAKK